MRTTLIECCSVLEDFFSESTGTGATGIKIMLRDPSFLHWLSFFNKIMPYVDILFAQLQSTATDAVKANKNFTAFYKALQKICDELVETAVTNESRKRQCEDDFTKIRKAKEVCDTIILQSQKRFKCTAHLKASKLLQLNNVSNFINTKHFPTLLLENCVKAYAMLDQEKLRGELMLLYSL